MTLKFIVLLLLSIIIVATSNDIKPVPLHVPADPSSRPFLNLFNFQLRPNFFQQGETAGPEFRNRNGGSPRVKLANGSLSHIFRKKEGHFEHDTPENRKLLTDLANDPRKVLGTDTCHGNKWSAETRRDGSQLWVSVRGNEIRNGGLNKIPLPYNECTGLSKPSKPTRG